jgi:hypothetical protein
MNNEWIDQSDSSILDLSSTSTVLIMFVDESNGITIDDGRTVDISWIRLDDIICATTGKYNVDDIKAWKTI